MPYDKKPAKKKANPKIKAKDKDFAKMMAKKKGKK